jgi:hypothetical protein
MNVSNRVIPAQAGIQSTSYQGPAFGQALRGKRGRNALRMPALIGDLGARLRGHDAGVRTVRYSPLPSQGDK